MVRYENIMNYGEMMLVFLSIREQVPFRVPTDESDSRDIL